MMKIADYNQQKSLNFYLIQQSETFTESQLVYAPVVRGMQVVLPFYQMGDVQQLCDLYCLTNSHLKAIHLL